MLISSSGGAWLAFYKVELGELRGQQLRGMFFFPDKDKALHVCVELRLDSKDGPLIGSMNVARQYTPGCSWPVTWNPATTVPAMSTCVYRISMLRNSSAFCG